VKDVRSQGLSSADMEEGVLQMRTSAFFVHKTSEFSKFMMCLYGQREGERLSRCGHFMDKRESGGQVLAILCGLFL